jgi:hypothetical protein
LGGTTYRPVNSILLGPIHTLHLPNGRETQPHQRWRSHMPEPAPGYNLRLQINRVKRVETLVRNQIRRCNFAEPLLGYIRQYCRALDESELSNSLLRLWATLEQITAPGKGNYDVVVNRTSFLWEDYKEARTILTYIKERRNELVHAGSEPRDVERLLYQLKRYVETTLWFLIQQAHRFSSLDECRNFWDLPPEVEVLRSRVGQHRRAITYRDRIPTDEQS